MHLAARVPVVSVKIGAQEKGAADLDRLFGECGGKFVVVEAGIGLDGVREHVHARIRGDVGRDALDELFVENRLGPGACSRRRADI